LEENHQIWKKNHQIWKKSPNALLNVKNFSSIFIKRYGHENELILSRIPNYVRFTNTSFVESPSL
jgi:hypothetical protein